MSIKAIAEMSPPATCLRPEASALEALQLMLDKEISCAPVCDQDNMFVGVVSTNQILLELIPPSAKVEQGLQNLKFAGDALPMLSHRLRELEQCPVGRITQKNIPILTEETPVLEAVLLLTQNAAPLPVVSASGHLLGMLSRRIVLAYLMRAAD